MVKLKLEMRHIERVYNGNNSITRIKQDVLLKDFENITEVNCNGLSITEITIMA